MDLSSDLDSLFQLPLNEFTGARNALASRLLKEGRKEEADHVRKLTKPPVSAWVVNQLFWKERTWFDRLLASGARLRQAQAAGLAGKPVNVHDPLKAQREALNQLSRQAAAFLSRDGHAPSADVLRRVTLDLQGLAAQDSSATGPAPGRLTADVEATGFDALAALVPKSGDGSSRDVGGGASKVLSFAPNRQPAAAKSTGHGSDQARLERERAQAAAARRAVQDAERTLAAARRDATRAEAAMKAAAARLKESEREKQKAEAALEKAAAAADTARQAARRTASEAADAAQAADDAERALARAKSQLQ
jgi:hypothetical protein